MADRVTAKELAVVICQLQIAVQRVERDLEMLKQIAFSPELETIKRDCDAR